MQRKPVDIKLITFVAILYYQQQNLQQNKTCPVPKTTTVSD